MTFFISILVSFCLLFGLLLFFLRFQKRIPYYRVDKDSCLLLLKTAYEGELPVREWHFFIGMNIQHEPELDTLRANCLQIDEQFVVGSHLVRGVSCVLFNSEGKQSLLTLMDEWRFKVDLDI